MDKQKRTESKTQTMISQWNRHHFCLCFQCFTESDCSSITNLVFFQKQNMFLEQNKWFTHSTVKNTSKMDDFQCNVCFQRFTQCDSSFISNVVCWLCFEQKEHGWLAKNHFCCEQTNETKMEESCVCFQCLTQCTCTTITNFVFYQIFHHKETNDLRNETHVSEQCPKECDWFSMHCSTGLLPNRQWDSLCFEQIEQSTLWKKQKETVIQNVPIRVPEEMCLFQVHLPTLQFLNAQRLNLCQTHCLVDETKHHKRTKNKERMTNEKD